MRLLSPLTALNLGTSPSPSEGPCVPEPKYRLVLPGVRTCSWEGGGPAGELYAPGKNMLLRGSLALALV